jgi:urease accessory protein
MFAGGPTSPRPAPLVGSEPHAGTQSTRLERTRGALSLGFAQAPEGAAPVRLHQEGALKVRLPTVHGERSRHAIVINTAGGLTGGDRLDLDVTLEPDAAVTISGQACEKLYKSSGGDAIIHTALAVAPGAHLEWLMQPAILFDGARLARKVTAEIAAGGRLLAVESIVFGRTAMLEDVIRGAVTDSWRLRRDGKLIYADSFRLEGEIRQTLDRPSVLDGHRAMASLIYVGDNAAERCAAFRAILGDMPHCVAAASAWNGLMTARIVAPDGYALTRDLIGLLTRFRDAKMPRAWMI